MAASSAHQVVRSFCNAVQALEISQQAQLAAVFVNGIDPQQVLAAAFEEVESSLKLQQNEAASERQQHIFSCIAVSLHILKQGARGFVVEQFVDKVFIPALQLEVEADLRKQQLQVARSLADILQHHGLWECALRVLRSCQAALQQLPTSAPSSGTAGPSPAQLPGSCTWPLPSVCFTVQHLLRAACTAAAVKAGARAFLESALELLLSPVQGLLYAGSVSVRQAAVHKLLPAMLEAATCLGGKAHSNFCSSVAGSCISAMQAKGPARQSGMALAVQFCELMQQELEGTLKERQDQFWTALQACLVELDPLTRKRAAHVLRALLVASNAESPAWNTWLMLYDLLDEFAAHLIRPAWEQISVLQPVASQYSGAAEAAAPQHPKKKLRGKKAASGTAATPAEDQGQDGKQECKDDASVGGAATGMEVAVVVDAAPADVTESSQMRKLDPTAFDWMRIIWERALLHPNIQVQKLALHSFLQRDWKPAATSSVTPSFIRTVMLPALLGHTQQKAAAVKDFVMQDALVDFLADYITSVEAPLRHEAFNILLEAACSKEPLPRQGLLLLLGSFSAAAIKSREALANVADAGTWGEEVLASLVSCAVCLSSYHGAGFKTAAYRSLLHLAAALTSTASMSLASAARLLQELPFHQVQPGGCLHAEAGQWLVPSEEAHKWFSMQMMQLLEAYVSDSASGSQGGKAVLEADFKVWETRSSSWALLAVVGGEATTPVLRPLVQSLAVNMQAIRTRPYLAPGIAERTLILLDALLFYALASIRNHATHLTPMPTKPSNDNDKQQPTSTFCPLAEALLSLINSHTALLASCCEAAAQVFWAVPSHLANAGTPQSDGSTRPSCSPALKMGSSKALKAVLCMTQALQLLSSFSAMPGRNLSTAISHLLQWIQSFTNHVQRLTDAYLREWAATPFQQDMLQGIEAVCRSLTVASNVSDPRLRASVAGVCAPKQLLTKALMVPACATGEGEKSAQHWSCIDAILGLQASLSCNAPSLTTASSQAGLTISLEPSVVSSLLLEALQALPGCPPNQLMPQLRCTRVLWAMCVTDKQAAVSVSSLLSARGDKEGNSPVEAVCWVVGRALMEALDLCSKRKAALCAAFVNTAMLPCVMAYQDDDADMVTLHQPGGPIHWLMDSMVRLNRPRVIVPLCLRLAAHVTVQPQLLADYTGLLQHLLVYASLNKGGSGLDLEASIDAVEAEELGAFTGQDNDSLQQSHSGTTIAARLALVCALHKVAVIAGLVHPSLSENITGGGSAGVSGAYSLKAQSAGLALWDGLYKLCTSDPLLSSDKYKVGSDLHRQKVRCWQTLTVLSNFVLEERMEQIVRELMDMYNQNNPSQVKMYQEALCTALLLRNPVLLENLVLPELQDVSKVRNSISSLILIAAQVALNLSPEQRQRLLPQVVLAIVPWGLCHSHTVRTFTQLVLHTVFERVPLDSPIWNSLNNGPHPTSQPTPPPLALPATQGTTPHGSSNTSSSSYVTSSSSYVPSSSSHILSSSSSSHILSSSSSSHVLSSSSSHIPSSPSSPYVVGGVQTGSPEGMGGVVCVQPLLQRWLQYLDGNHDMVRLRKTLGAVIPRFTPKGLTSPRRIFVEGVQLAGGSEEGVTFEGAPPSIMDQLLDFLNYERSRLRDSLQERESEQEYFPDTSLPHPSTKPKSQQSASSQQFQQIHAASPQPLEAKQHSNKREEQGTSGPNEKSTSDFQRKISPLARIALPSADAFDPMAELADFQQLALWDEPNSPKPTHTNDSSSSRNDSNVTCNGSDENHNIENHSSENRSSSAVTRQDDSGQSVKPGAAGLTVDQGLQSTRPQLIVVASLIDKLPNLAGLARTCEVFQASALVLPDVRITKEPAFASISVTAEKWVPMIEVKENALLPWLEKRKQQGWELVGLEQTAEAVALPQFEWPRKVVLVLGREKEGLPPEVIQMLDHAVEIPQFGIIRSLNVHVSAAITIYEFTKQARCS